MGSYCFLSANDESFDDHNRNWLASSKGVYNEELQKIFAVNNNLSNIINELVFFPCVPVTNFDTLHLFLTTSRDSYNTPITMLGPCTDFSVCSNRCAPEQNAPHQFSTTTLPFSVIHLGIEAFIPDSIQKRSNRHQRHWFSRECYDSRLEN